MKVWKLEEGKIYMAGGSKFRFKEGMLETIHKNNDGVYWYKTGLTYNDVMALDFIEVVDTNSHWKPNRERIAFIDHDFDSVKISNFLLDNTEDVNMFHVNDKKKVECLALEFKIKSVLLNWRRLHDDVELAWENGAFHKFNISHDIEENKIEIVGQYHFINSKFGYFSSKEKTQQFYEYMKEDIDRYFQMRKELKF